MKKFFYLIGFFAVFSFSTIAFAQPTPPPAPPSETVPGCKISWTAPMIDDPDNPGTQISQWDHAGDLHGFVFVTQKSDQQVWDKLLEQRIEDPSLLLIDCPTVGIEALGTYSLGITAQDHALNQSPPAWITFNIIAPDTEALFGIPEICMNGSLNNLPMKTCQRPGVPLP